MENIIVLKAPEFPSEIKLENEWLERKEKLLNKALAIKEVKDQDNYDDAEVALSRVAKIIKEVDKKRLGFTKPFRDFTKQINDMTKAAVDDLEVQKKRIKGLLTEYVIAKEEEAAKALEENVTPLLESSFAEHADNIVVPEAKVSRSMTSVRKAWTFELIDIAAVPLEFLAIDESKVRKYIQNNKEMASIPGIRIFQETSVVNR